MLASGASVFQHPTFLRRIDNLLMDMAVQSEMAHWLMDRFTDFYMAYFDRMLTAANGRIDILRGQTIWARSRGCLSARRCFALSSSRG